MEQIMADHKLLKNMYERAMTENFRLHSEIQPIKEKGKSATRIEEVQTEGELHKLKSKNAELTKYIVVLKTK